MSDEMKIDWKQKLDIGGIKLYAEYLGGDSDRSAFVFDSGYAWTSDSGYCLHERDG